MWPQWPRQTVSVAEQACHRHTSTPTTFVYHLQRLAWRGHGVVEPRRAEGGPKSSGKEQSGSEADSLHSCSGRSGVWNSPRYGACGRMEQVTGFVSAQGLWFWQSIFIIKGLLQTGEPSKHWVFQNPRSCQPGGRKRWRELLLLIVWESQSWTGQGGTVSNNECWKLWKVWQLLCLYFANILVFKVLCRGSQSSGTDRHGVVAKYSTCFQRNIAEACWGKTSDGDWEHFVKRWAWNVWSRDIWWVGWSATRQMAPPSFTPLTASIWLLGMQPLD